MSYQPKGLAILNNNPYPLQQTWSKDREKTINRRSNSFIDMKTVFSKTKISKGNNYYVSLLFHLIETMTANKNRLLMENNQLEAKFGALV